MAQIKSLRDDIMERLSLKSGAKSAGKSQKNMVRGNARGASLNEGAQRRGTRASVNEQVIRKGSTALYNGKPVKVQAINESGMAIVQLERKRDPIYVRASDLRFGNLNEGVLGMAPISYTYVEPRQNKMPQFERLTAADLGLFETDRVDTEYGDEGEEDADNGSNMRHDGHSGRTEVDALPTASDTILTAYSDKIPPKHRGTPLSIEKGAEEDKLWQQPDFDGYTYPADAPDIPEADYPADVVGNTRAPKFGDFHEPGDGIKDYNFDGSDENKDNKSKSPPKKPQKEAQPTDEGFSFANYRRLVAEMDDSFGGGDSESHKGGGSEKITVTLPAMASIVCTAIQFADPMILKSMIEALADVGKGKTIDVSDLDAVAAHVNGGGGECPDSGGPPNFGGDDHGGSDDDDGGESHKAPPFGGKSDHDSDDDGDGDSHKAPPFGKSDDDSDYEPSNGDGEPSKEGKTKLMGGLGEAKLVDFYGLDDIVKEMAMSEDDEIRLLRSRANLRYWSR